MSTPEFCFCIATYRRPEGLRLLLRSIQAAAERADVEFSVVVVDNDPWGSAESVAMDCHARYVCEARPGIAAARNRSLSERDVTASWLVFVDDDETLDPDWFLVAKKAMSDYPRASVFVGHVQSCFPEQTPAWIADGGFHQREPLPRGSVHRFPPSNNTIVRAAIFDDPAVRFNDDYSVSGGSDTELFYRLRGETGPAIAVPELVVLEAVPEDRLTWRWVRRRAVRSGSVMVRVRRQDSGRFSLAFQGVCRAVYFGGRLGFQAALGRSISARNFNGFFFGLGMLAALVGLRTREYVRRPTSLGEGRP